jgi:signal peptidase II
MISSASFSFFVFLFCFVLDRVSKVLVLANIDDCQVVLTPYLNLCIVWNRGICWSMFSNSGEMFAIGLKIFILIVILVFFFNAIIRYLNAKNIFFDVIVLAGAISNFLDRFVYGEVLDFLDFHIGGFHWPVFNLADVFIVAGVFGMLTQILMGDENGNDKKAMF